MYCYSPCPQPCTRPPLTHAFTRDSQTPTDKSPVGSLFLSPGSWCTRFCCALQESISQSYVSSGSSMVGLMATSSKRTYAIPTRRARPCSRLLPTHTSAGNTQTQFICIGNLKYGFCRFYLFAGHVAKTRVHRFRYSV